MRRDDQLQLAFEAEAALEIARTLPNKKLRAIDGGQLFQIAFDLHLKAVEEQDRTRYTRSQFLAYAGTIQEFCIQAGYFLNARGRTPVSLFNEALAAAAPPDRRRRLRREPTRAVLIGQLAARSLRLAGNTEAARELVAKPEGYFFATGAEPMRARYEHELALDLLHDGQANQVRHALSESESFWQQGRAVRFDDRHRFRYAIALTDWEVGRLDEAERQLYQALAELDDGAKGAIDEWPELCRLSLTLAIAEMHLERAASRADPRADRAACFHRLAQALYLTQQLRARWRVVLRSRSPLSTVIQRVWGDMARVSAELGGPAAERLGAQIALAAKQSGFASLMRTERSLLTEDGRDATGRNERSMSVRVVGIIDQLSRLEGQGTDPQLAARPSTPEQLGKDLQHLREELVDQMTPVLADFIVPRPVDLTEISGNLGKRVGLDFVGLQETLSERADRPTWYRTVFTPGDEVEFSCVQPGAAFRAYFLDADPWESRLAEDGAVNSEVWAGLGEELLPEALRHQLSQADPARPIRLVISGHGALSHFPWAALKVDGVPLPEKAIISQALDLMGLVGGEVAEITGPALVRLVALPVTVGNQTLPALDVGAECDAWRVRRPEFGARPSMYDVPRIGEGHTELTEELTATLRTPRTRLTGEHYRFLHVAAHGTGTGLGQQVHLPNRLSAGAALGLLWPPAVLMACCRLGRVHNTPDSEPFGFIICLLSANVRGVVAGVDEIDDTGAGAVASSMVRQAWGRSVPIDEALRTAQLESLRLEKPLNHWALLTTYVC